MSVPQLTPWFAIESDESLSLMDRDIAYSTDMIWKAAGNKHVGCVIVYKKDSNDDNGRYVFFERLNGPLYVDLFGESVSMALNGLILAVGIGGSCDTGHYDIRNGSVYIYSRESASDLFLGKQTIDGPLKSSCFGKSVAMSSTSLKLAVGAPNSNHTGSVYIYSRNSTSDKFSMYRRLDGPLGGDGFGYSVDIPAKGSSLIVGMPFAGRGFSTGSVQLYKEEENSSFVKTFRFDGACQNENLGRYGVTLDITESAMIIRGRGRGCSGNNRNSVRSYKLGCTCGNEKFKCSDYTNWPNVVCKAVTSSIIQSEDTSLQPSTSVGHDYATQWKETYNNKTVSITDGYIAYSKDNIWKAEGDKYYGSVRILKKNYTNGQYVIFQELHGVSGEMFGETVTMSNNGLELGIGAPFADGFRQSSGCIYIYSRDSTSSDFVEKQRLGGYFEGNMLGKSMAMSPNGLGLFSGAAGSTLTGSVYIFSRDSASYQFVEKQRIDGPWEGGVLYGHKVAISSNGLVLAVGAPDADHGFYGGSLFIYTKDKPSDNFNEVTRFDGACEDERLGYDSIVINTTETALTIDALGRGCYNSNTKARFYELECKCANEDYTCGGFTNTTGLVCEAGPTSLPTNSSLYPSDLLRPTLSPTTELLVHSSISLIPTLSPTVYTLNYSNAPSTALFEFVIELKTDNDAFETSWSVKNMYGDVMAAGDQYLDSTFNNESHFLPSGSCYTFSILDSFADGICCNNGFGSYSIFFNKLFVGGGGEFGSSEEIMFGNCSISIEK